MNLIKLSFSTLALSTLLFASNYKIDSNTSKAEFSIKYLKNEEIKGNFKTVKGDFNFDEKKYILNSLNGEVEVDSLTTSKNDLATYILSEKIFNEKKYPKIKFVATKIEQDRIFGDLTIRNVTKNVEFDLENSGEFFGKIYLKISGKIQRSYFDLTWDELLDTGSSSVDNDIFIEIDIEAKKEEKLNFTKVIEKSKK
jgi:polyisoprenoid-binding protein YceI